MRKYNHKRDIIRLLLLALTAFYCILPLFIHQGLPYAHDIIFHIFQADQFDRALHEGVFYPRWVLDSNNGYGSANFVFYSPLSYYFVSAIKIFTPSLTTAMIIAIWLGFFLSGITMFIATRKMFGESVSALPAVIYQILPFHLWDIYIRGTLAEFLAFIWFPLIILFLYETIESRNKASVIGLSISYAGLILTHLVSGFIFSLLIGAYFLYTFFSIKERKNLFKTGFSLILGLGLSAVYLLPVIFERRFVQIDYIVNCPVGDYKKNFLFTWDKIQTVLRNFYLPMHIGVILEVILFLFIIFMIRKNRQIFSHRPMINFFAFLFFSAFFLTTPLSRPVWDLVPGFPFLQFPWRWIPIMELSLCFLIGVLFAFEGLSSLRNTTMKRAINYILIIFSLISLATITKSTVIPDTSVKKFINPEQVKHLMDPPLEYTPVWVENIKPIMSETRNKRVSVISGMAIIHIVEWKSEKRVINVEASTPALLRISTFYYPGWEAEIDGNKIQIGIEKESGAMLVNIPKGEHSLIFQFKDTPIRYYAKLISLASVFIITVLLLVSKKPGRKQMGT
jgi:uncharacterized membrane protein